MSKHVNVLTYPLSYLSLQDENSRKIYKRNGVAVLLIAASISVPFVFFDANYFGDKGFLDRFGSFSAVLTGFYIAALVGVASFAASVGDLDDEIQVGKIRRFTENPDDDPFLTRRQYVCAMFGYLSFSSLVLSVSAILLIVASTPIASAIRVAVPEYAVRISAIFGIFVVLVFNLLLSHLLITTCYGLYYLIDRLYATKPTMLPKKNLAGRKKN